jgi:hypothetical protein
MAMGESSGLHSPEKRYRILENLHDCKFYIQRKTFFGNWAFYRYGDKKNASLMSFSTLEQANNALVQKIYKDTGKKIEIEGKHYIVHKVKY